MENDLAPTTNNNIPERLILQSFYLTSARYDFDIMEKRLLTCIINGLQHLLEGKKLKGVYTIENSLFDKKISFPTSLLVGKDNNHRHLYQSIERLQSKKLKYEDKNRWISIPIVGKVEHDKRKGILSIFLYNEIVDLFLNFTKGYSSYIFSTSLSLTSVSSARIYELISNQPRPITYEIEHLKTILGVEETYSRTCNFMQRVIKRAKEELDQKSNWSFDYTTRKVGRAGKIVSITLKPIHYIEREPEEVQHAERERRLSLLWHLDNQTKLYLRKVCNFTTREIKNNMQTLETYLQKHGARTIPNFEKIWRNAQNADNPKGYFIASLQNGIKNDPDQFTETPSLFLEEEY